MFKEVLAAFNKETFAENVPVLNSTLLECIVIHFDLGVICQVVKYFGYVKNTRRNRE